MSRDLETKLRVVIESMTDGIYMTDANGVCIACNYAFKRITGIVTDIVGKHVTYLLEQQLITEAVTLETIETRRHVSKIIKYPSGCEALVTGNPVLDESGDLIAVVSVVRDLSGLNALKEDLKKSKELAKQYVETLRKFTSPVNVPLDKLIVRDPKMQRVLDVILRIADSDVTVILYGESGVGKGMIATLIHQQSSRREKGQMVKIDCGAIPGHLLESELFGYESGAFTGARREGKIGLFELANHGTLFLDEIGELPLALQVKLLNVLQDRQIMRVGGARPIPIDVRILCATNRNLETMVADGTFRQDLYYRLNVVPITILPLRERKEDILVLTVSFLDRFNKKYQHTVSASPEVIDYFLEYSWPGNVRELENTVERLVVLNQNGVIRSEDLPEKIRAHFQSVVTNYNTEVGPKLLNLKTAVAITERRHIEESLRQNKTLAASAEKLGIDVSTLLRKCKRYGINRADI